MAVPRRHDKLMKHLMSSDRTESPKAYSTSEETEFNSLKYDINNGMKLPLHKINRYAELKQKLGK